MARLIRLLESTQRLEERTPGIARALRALAAAKRRNRAAVARGDAAHIAGKRVSIRAYVRKYGKPKTKRAAEAMAASPDLLDDAEIEQVDLLDADDVEFAVGILTDAGEDPEDLRSFVIERANQLGVPHLIPDEWTAQLPKPDEEPGPDAEGAQDDEDDESDEDDDEDDDEPEPEPDGLTEADEDEEIEGPCPTLDELDDFEVAVVEEYVAEAGTVVEATGQAQAQSTKAPKFIFGRLNKAYRRGAPDSVIGQELGSIASRARARGYGVTEVGAVSTFAKNLEARVRQQITAYAQTQEIEATPEWSNTVFDRLRPAMDEMVLKAFGVAGVPAQRIPEQFKQVAKPEAAAKPMPKVKRKVRAKVLKPKPVVARAKPKVTPPRRSTRPKRPAGTVLTPSGTPLRARRMESYTSAGLVLTEAEPGKGNVFDVLVIQPGMSRNGRRYRPAVLEASAPLLEGARSFVSDGVDHDPRKRGVKALAGWWSHPRYDRSVKLPNGKVVEGLVSRYHVTDRGLADTLRESLDGGKPDLITFSIVADGEVQRVTEAGKTLVDVVRINAYESVDPVINAAAGGMAVRLVASVEDPSMDWALLTLAEAVKGFVSGEITAVDLQSNRPDLFAAIEGGRITVAENSGPDVKATIAEALAPFQTERMVEAVLAGHARLPDIVKARIREAASAKVEVTKHALTAEEVTALVETESEYLAAINPAIVSNAGPVVTDMKSERERVTEAMYQIISGQSNNSFRALYEDLTGDRAMTGRLQEGGRLTESMTTTTFAEVLGDSITRRMLEVYRLPDLGQWRELVNVVPLNDFRTQRRIRVGGYGNLPAVGQGQPYLALTTPGDEEATYSISKKGGTEDITMETIANDDLGAIRNIPTRLGRAGAQTLFEFVFDFLATNATIYDSTALAVSGHNNYGTTALGASSLIAARSAMKKQTDMSNGKRLGIKPKFLVVPIELEQTAYELTETDREVASANNTVNFIRTFTLTPLVVDYWTDATNWWLVADKNLVPTIEIGFFNGREEPEVFLQDMPNVGSVFSNDTLTYKIRHIYGGAVVDFRGFYGAIVAG